MSVCLSFFIYLAHNSYLYFEFYKQLFLLLSRTILVCPLHVVQIVNVKIKMASLPALVCPILLEVRLAVDQNVLSVLSVLSIKLV